jgi:hypothetical protein
MVESCTIREPVAEASDLDRALEAAVGLWALIEAAEPLPASIEAQECLTEARLALGVQLVRLGWDEEFLRANLLKAPLHRGEPPGKGPLRYQDD